MTNPPLYRELFTQQQIDDEYNPSIKLDDPAQYARHYVERSREARERLRCVLDVPFGATLPETLDIFPAETSGPAPVFVFIHGGYWRSFSSKEFGCTALGLQPKGITTVVVNYALAPYVTLDEIARQVRASLAWVLRHIGEHGGDPTRVAVGGHSAGGQLTAMALQTRWVEDYGLPRDPFKAAVLVSGIYDLRPLRYSYLQPMIQLDDGIVERNSPLFGVRPCATPALITWGGDESAEFARQSLAFRDAWDAQGNVSTLLPQPGAHHFTATDGFENPDSAVCQWLAERLGV